MRVDIPVVYLPLSLPAETAAFCPSAGSGGAGSGSRG
jgi:hypothetical protein